MIRVYSCCAAGFSVVVDMEGCGFYRIDYSKFTLNIYFLLTCDVANCKLATVQAQLISPHPSLTLPAPTS